MLCVVPLLRSVRVMFPESQITLVTSPVNYEIMKHHPYVDDVLNYDKLSFFPSMIEAVKFWKSLRSTKYDMAIVPATVSVSVTSDLIAFLSGARIRIGASGLLGKTNPTAFCFTHTTDLDWSNDPHRHQSLRNLDVIKFMNPPVEDLSCVIGLTEQEQEDARSFLRSFRDDHKLLVGLHVGAGKVENRWSAERFAAIANRISLEYQAGILITVGPKDSDLVEIMKQHIQVPSIFVQNHPIRSVAAIINELDFFISNDTGIMHVAGATKTSLLALFGPTDPLQWMSQGAKNRYIASRNGSMDSIPEAQVCSLLTQMINEKN